MVIASVHSASSVASSNDADARRRRAIHGQLIAPACPTDGQPLQEVVAQRQRLAADHEHDDDHDERHRLAEARLVDVAVELGLRDADERGRRRARSGTSGTRRRARRPSAARIRFVIAVTCSVTIGAMRIAARPASAEPSAQLSVAMRSGDQPSAAAARSFSATAVVARPNCVKR